MNQNLRKTLFLLWDAFAVFALVFTVSMMFALHSALIVSAEFIVIFLFLLHRLMNWSQPKRKENIFRTAFWHCMRGYGVIMLAFILISLIIASFGGAR